MRIIHTADWHLGEWLRTVDRTEDLRARVEVVAGLCEEHEAEVLLIAGDLFSEQASVAEMTVALTHLHEAFARFFERGGTILSITGNHDREDRIEMVRAGMLLAAPDAGRRRFLAGRMYLLNRPSFGTLETAAGERAQFVLIPYPTSSRYADPDDAFRSKEEENRVLQSRVAAEIQAAGNHPEFDRGLPTILAAHLHVRGAEVHRLYKITERDDVVFDPGLLPTAWSYVGLGHIHRPQCLAGLPHMRYPGSLDRLHFDERDDEKGVVLIDLGASGLRAEPVWLPIAATPMLDVVVADGADLHTIAERYPDREKAIARIRVASSPAGPSRHEITAELRRLFPRQTEIVWVRPEGASGRSAADALRSEPDHRTVIRRFLTTRLEGDPDRDEILALAERYLTSESAP